MLETTKSTTGSITKEMVKEVYRKVKANQGVQALTKKVWKSFR